MACVYFGLNCFLWSLIDLFFFSFSIYSTETTENHYHFTDFKNFHHKACLDYKNLRWKNVHLGSPINLIAFDISCVWIPMELEMITG